MFIAMLWWILMKLTFQIFHQYTNIKKLHFFILVFIAYLPYARAPNTYLNYILVFKFEQSSYLFSLKNSRPCRDLNPILKLWSLNKFIHYLQFIATLYAVGCPNAAMCLADEILDHQGNHQVTKVFILF